MLALCICEILAVKHIPFAFTHDFSNADIFIDNSFSIAFSNSSSEERSSPKNENSRKK